MSIERERKFIASPAQTEQLSGHRIPSHITQHYLSPTGAASELRLRRTASDFTDPNYVTTIKQGSGEYRQETEVPLLAAAYLSLSSLALGTVLKNRYQLARPGLTLDSYRDSPTRAFGLLELEQENDQSDIGLFDPSELGAGDLTEVTGQPAFYNRNLAQITPQKERPMPSLASLEQIHSYIDKLSKTARPAIITLSGPSCSGKTTILEYFKNTYGERCLTISTDDYYIGKSRMRTEMPEGHTANFDHPAAIDTTRLARDIKALRGGKTIQKPLYNMKQSEPFASSQTITPAKIIIIEGIAANLPELKQQSDLSLAITAPIEERLRRRMERDINRKGHTPEQTLSTFLNHVEPSYQTYFAGHDQAVDYLLATK